jgi:hypothetical protein
VSDIRKVLEEVGGVMTQIDAAYDSAEQGDLKPEIPCPRCATPLNYSKAVTINNHRHAMCPKEGCGFGFVE